MRDVYSYIIDQLAIDLKQLKYKTIVLVQRKKKKGGCFSFLISPSEFKCHTQFYLKEETNFNLQLGIQKV